MSSYFYEAGYNASKYEMSEALAYAQVAIHADNHDCASLYKPAIKSFAYTVKAVGGDERCTIAAFIYEYTTIAAPAHVEIPDIVVDTVASRHSIFSSTLRNQNIVDLLRSDADLATDLLLTGRHCPKEEEIIRFHFTCGHCNYSHAAVGNCLGIWRFYNGVSSMFEETRKDASVHTEGRLIPGFSLRVCNEFHTIEL
jgi:hypothetical protein